MFDDEIEVNVTEASEPVTVEPVAEKQARS